MTLPFRRVLELGPTAQPTVAGLYAWAVTVAPVGFGAHPRGAGGTAAALFAVLALLALASGAASDVVLRRRGKTASLERWRTLSLFSFAAASLVTWICDTDALAPVRLSAARGVAGMLGWALFAFAFAAPVVEPVESPARVTAGARARGQVERGDALFVAITAALVAGLQLLGWSVQSPERAILVRVTTVGAGIVLFGAMGAFLATRHGRVRDLARGRARTSRTPLPYGWLLALVLLLTAGVFYVLTK